MRFYLIFLIFGISFVFWTDLLSADEIHRAARKGDVERTKQLINEAVPVDKRDRLEQTPLYIAAKFGRLELVKYLLSEGADPSLVATGPDGPQGNSLHISVLWGHLEVVRILLDAGADVNANDPTFGSPLHIARVRKHKDIEALIKSRDPKIREAEPIDRLIAQADPARGNYLSGSCKLCHRFSRKPDGEEYNGPPLWNIVGRFIASSDFKYSETLLKTGGVWDYQSLNSFIKDPRGFIPGTKMEEKGLKEEAARAAVIAYLRTLSDDPVPLPRQ